MNTASLLHRACNVCVRRLSVWSVLLTMIVAHGLLSVTAMSIKSVFPCVVAIAATMNPWVVRDVWAADPIVVKILSNGPDRAYPLGQEFRVEGAPEKLPEQMDLVFVRSEQRFLGLGDPTKAACSKVRDAITSDGYVMDIARDDHVGRVRLEELWPNAKDHRSLWAYRATPWKKASDKDKTYSLLVAADSFFHSGAQYCAFLLEKDKRPLATDKIIAAVNKFVAAWAVCDNTGQKPCVQVSKEFESDYEAATKNAALETGDQDAIKKKLGELKAALVNAGNNHAMLEEASSYWGIEIFKPNRSVALDPSVIETTYLDVNEHVIGRTMVGMLVAHGDLMAVPVPPKEKAAHGDQSAAPVPPEDKKEVTLDYYTNDGNVRVTHVRLAGDLTSKIKVTSDPKTKETANTTRTLDLTAAQLPLPDSDITLRDLLEFWMHRFKFSSGYKTFKDGYDSTLKPVLHKNGLDFDANKYNEAVVPFSTWLGKMDAVLTRAWQERPTKEPSVPILLRWKNVYKPLQKWMDEVVETCPSIDAQLRKPRTPPLTTDFKELANKCPDEKKKEPKSCCVDKPTTGADTPTTCADTLPTWHRFAQSAGNPLVWMTTTLRNISDKSGNAITIKTELAAHKQQSATQVSSAMTVAAKVDREAWFGQHVMTTTGIARVSTANDPLVVNYYGFKLYPWANPVDEPKSILNWDWYRTVSLELGFVPNLQAFGPSGRYQGLSRGAVPPLMAGLALQPIPYITLSVGATFLESRRTTLTQETPQLFVGRYIGLAADVNILDIAAKALGAGRVTKISELAK